MSDTGIFVIPAYNPTKQLILLIKEIRSKCCTPIIVVNDGSHPNSEKIFQNLIHAEGVILLEHNVNQGKGAALKTAFNYILLSLPHITHSVVLDADGQHAVSDCMKIMGMMRDRNNTLILGCRKFDRNIPLRSYLGNNISRLVYRLVLGRWFKDTQTGLRGLSRSFMKLSLTIHSNRFEFETEQLALAVKKIYGVELIETEVKTKYFEGNENSSFRPLLDSIKIYFVLIRYIGTSIVIFFTDIFIFSLMLLFGNTILVANMSARVVTIVVQFFLVRKLVFKSEGGIFTFIFFSTYVLTMGVVSSQIQISLNEHLGIHDLTVKLIVEGGLFLLNFAFLRTFIFPAKN